MVDEEVFVTKLEHVDEFVADLEEMRGVSRKEYLENLVVQRAVERTLMNLVQACIDLASHVRRSEDLGPAETSKEEIDCLHEDLHWFERFQRQLATWYRDRRDGE